MVRYLICVIENEKVVSNVLKDNEHGLRRWMHKLRSGESLNRTAGRVTWITIMELPIACSKRLRLCIEPSLVYIIVASMEIKDVKMLYLLKKNMSDSQKEKDGPVVGDERLHGLSKVSGPVEKG
ncbi:hypothetical protein Tco_1197324 [Tanacetum coccineum]